jgi:hypothetical protein
VKTTELSEENTEIVGKCLRLTSLKQISERWLLRRELVFFSETKERIGVRMKLSVEG